jgi:hypothetical protein
MGYGVFPVLFIFVVNFVANFVDPSRSFIFDKACDKVCDKVCQSLGLRMPSSLRSTVAAGRERGGLVYGAPPGSFGSRVAILPFTGAFTARALQLRFACHLVGACLAYNSIFSDKTLLLTYD